MSKQNTELEMRQLEEENRTTVGELRKALSGYPDNTQVTFGNTLDGIPLMFYRVKGRGDDLVQIELNEASFELATSA